MKLRNGKLTQGLPENPTYEELTSGCHLGANGPCAKVDKRRVGSELVYIDQVGPVGGSSFIRSWGYCPYCRGDYKGTSANRAQFVVDIRHEANVNY